MVSNLVTRVAAALDFPVYVFMRTTTGFVCHKITTLDSKIHSTKYFITGINECSCLAYIKNPRPCKHLQMLRDDFSWVGVSDAVWDTMSMLETLLPSLRLEFPKSSLRWDFSDDRSFFSGVVLPLDPSDVPKNVVCVVGTPKGLSGESLGIMLKVVT
mgnify:FL=1|jgi:hypothetical protein